MPYRRNLRLVTPLLSWLDLELLEPLAEWSDAYRVESPRLLLPRTHWFECELSGRRRIHDSVSPLWLTPDVTYRMRQPKGGQRSIVLVMHNPPPPAPAPRPDTLSSGALLELAQLRKSLDDGMDCADALAAEECLVRLVTQICGEGGEATLPSWHRAVERAREHLASSPETNDSLAEIASAVHCSPFHLARRFRRESGLSLHAYRTRLRMSIAVERLRGGADDLGALAADLGYSSHSHFTSTFRRAFGATPRQVRTNLTARRAR